MSSIRKRLTARLVTVTAVLSLCAGVSIYAYIRQAMLKQFDAGLATKAQAIASLLIIEPDGSYELEFDEQSMPEYSTKHKPEFFIVISSSGATIKCSRSLDGKTLFDPVSARAQKTWDLLLPDGRRGRAMAINATPHLENDERHDQALAKQHIAAQPALVIVAKERSDVDRVLAALLSSLVATIFILMAAGALVVRLIIVRCLQPLNSLAARATSIRPETLDYRFHAPSMPAELQPICKRLNDLLERLEQAFGRERRINADIAHELRTPIAELRTLTEVAARWPMDAHQTAGYFRDTNEIAMRMESLVETLLALARCHAGRMSVDAQAVELVPLIDSILERLHGRIEDRNLTVEMNVPAGQRVRTDPIMFRAIIENLISNAVEYAPPGGKIACAAQATPGRCALTIANSNDSLMETDLKKLFEPFWRKDASRCGDVHSGLGLSLVAEYARILNISVTPFLSGDWFEMRLVIATPHAGLDLADSPELPAIVTSISSP